jgi:signal transduction histidine kinase
LYGWAAAEALGRVTHHLLHTRFPVSRADVEAILLAHDRWDGELVHQRRDDTRVVVASRQVLRRDEQGLPVAILEINTDITARTMTLAEQVTLLEEQQSVLKERLTAAEAAMLQAARLAAVGQLAAAIAHEINNPLYAARNCLYLIEQDLPAPLRDGPYFSLARDQLARIASIIERMRDFYRPARGELAPHDLNQLLADTLALTGLNMRYTAISVVFEPQRDLPPVVANGDQLRQVFLNLILNALDAMDNGGTLTIRTAAGPTVALAEIIDTGVGIPPDVRERLFEPFFTTKSNGTGLGLSISAHIVTQHGGQIDVESSLGQGSTFRVVLPYQPTQ